MIGSLMFLRKRTVHSSFCHKISVDSFNIENRLDGNKSIGPDGFHLFVLKHCALCLFYPICLLCFKSLESGVVPDAWNIVNINPIFKS
jgi:hypothetical protein